MPKVEEREITFAVRPSWSMPDLTTLLTDGLRLETSDADLSATYLDTELATLRRLGVTFRRRSGGDDAGWHLKVPAGQARTEYQSRSQHSEPPEILTDRISGLVGEQPLREVATIDTHRRITRLIDADDRLVLEVADDTVRSATMGSESRLDSWREIEVELGPGGDEFWLRKAAKHLTRNGAKPQGVTMKLGRALGVNEQPVIRRRVAALVADYLVEQGREVLFGDLALRDQLRAGTVHRTRVAIRRIRSTLRVFGSMISGGPVDELDADLRWLAGLLGPIRDGDILARNLEQRLDRLPVEYILGPVRRQIAEELAADRSAAVQAWRTGLADERYSRLMRTLATWLVEPPVRDVEVDGERFVTKAAKKVKVRMANADGDVEQLHRARKAAKRLRYTAELLGSGATGSKKLARTKKAAKTSKIAKRAKSLQTLLGHHQDCVVEIGFLARLGRQGAEAGRNGFTYGLLLGQAERDAADIRARIAR